MSVFDVVTFPLAIALVHAVLWYAAIDLEGAWRQAPAIDESHDLRTAWLFSRALREGDLAALVHTWVHGSPVHTPLVPFVSGVLMALFGESRVVAEAVMPMFTAVWLIATGAVVSRLYDRRTARWTVLLSSAFPVFLIYSRTYLFDHPLAAVFACACWALLRTRGFADRRASIVFGVLAGLAALARGGGAIFLVGPVSVALAAVRREPDFARRLGGAALAALTAAAIAASWYAPNLADLAAYVFRATYGADAIARTGGSRAFSLESAGYYVTWLVAQGPGVPMLIVAIAAWIAGAPWRRTARPSPIAIALAAAFAIDFVLLLFAAQRQTARYFLPLVPLIALAICRANTAVASPLARRAAFVAVAALAVHHIVAMNLPYTAETWATRAPYVRGVPLWDHRPYFGHLVAFYRLRTPADDFRVPDTIAFLSRLGLRPEAEIGAIGPLHAFFQPNGLQLEAVRRRLAWTFVWSTALEPPSPDPVAAIPVPAPDAILYRWGGPTGIPAATRWPTVYVEAGRLELGDGSVVSILVDRLAIVSPPEDARRRAFP